MMTLVLFVLSLVFVAESLFFGSAPVTPSDVAGQEFHVYWNVPTFMCHKYGLFFEEVHGKYGILQNSKDQFRGDRIAILYDPGMFPALLTDSNGHVTKRNGGVPQEGNLTKHLEVFREHLIGQIPDKSFNGVGVIDFESWRPIFRQNWASLEPYKQQSIEIVRRTHPLWNDRKVKQEAERKFEKYGRLFMAETLKLAKSYRPFAAWSYYAYPYCYNLTPKQPSSQCDKTTVLENDKMSWLFELEDVLLPSVYLRISLTSDDRVGLVGGRVREALRIAKETTPRKKVLPYYWYKYQDQRNQYLTANDLEATLRKIRDLGADGFIVWGSSDDINTKEKCLGFREYLNDVLGPTIRQFTQADREGTQRVGGDPESNQVVVNVD